MMEVRPSKHLTTLLYVLLGLSIAYLAGQVLTGLPPVLAAALAFTWRVFFPVLTGMMFAYLLIPVLRFFEKKLNYLHVLNTHPRYLRGVGILFTYLAVFLGLGALGAYLVPMFFNNISEFMQKLPQFKADLEDFISRNPDLYAFWQNPKVQEVWEGLWASVADYAPAALLKDGSLAVFGQRLLDLIFALVLSVYFLMEKENLRHTFRDLTKVLLKGRTQGFFTLCGDMDRVFGKYLSAQIVQAFLIFAGSALVMQSCK
jgi:predicted PurR-regulated permease PerM